MYTNHLDNAINRLRAAGFMVEHVHEDVYRIANTTAHIQWGQITADRLVEGVDSLLELAQQRVTRITK